MALQKPALQTSINSLVSYFKNCPDTDLTLSNDHSLFLFRVSARRKALGRMRQNDYKKYEWLLEKLNLLYKPQPHDAPDGVVVPRELVARKVTRSSRSIVLVTVSC